MRRLFLSLNGKGEPPYEWIISRVCEEFSCLPSEAVHELENDSERLVLRVLPLRVFARAKEVYDNAKSKKDLPDHPMIDTVVEIDFDLAREELAEAAKDEKKRGDI